MEIENHYFSREFCFVQNHPWGLNKKGILIILQGYNIFVHNPLFVLLDVAFDYSTTIYYTSFSLFVIFVLGLGFTLVTILFRNLHTHIPRHYIWIWGRSQGDIAIFLVNWSYLLPVYNYAKSSVELYIKFHNFNVILYVE